MPMKSIILNEYTKIWSYRAFRVIILLHFILFFLVVLVTSRLDITIPGFSTDYLYQFPNIWEFFPWVASWFNLLLAILIIVVTGNEYTFPFMFFTWPAVINTYWSTAGWSNL